MHTFIFSYQASCATAQNLHSITSIWFTPRPTKGVDKLTWDTQICRSYVSIPNNGQIRHPQTAIHQMLPSLLAIDRSDAQTRHGAQILASLEQGK